MDRQKLLLGCVLMFLSGIPFALKIVPPNESFGLHTHVSLTSPDSWLRANSFAGWTFVAAAVVGFIIVRFRPDLAESSGLLIFVGLMMAALATTFLYLGLIT